MPIHKLYVLQQPVTEDSMQVYSESPRVLPKSVLVPDVEKLQTVLIDSFFDDQEVYIGGDKDNLFNWAYYDVMEQLIITSVPQNSLTLPDCIVKELKVKEGDKIDLRIDEARKLVIVTRINNVGKMELVTAWPSITDENVRTDYPFRRIGLAKDGFSLRVMEAWAPIGLGQCLFVKGVGGTGKTHILVDLFKALVKKAALNSNMHVIVCFIGERKKDVTLYRDSLNEILSSPTVNPRKLSDRVEIFSAPAHLSPKHQWPIARFAFSRAERLACCYDTVLIMDSASRAADAYSKGGFAKTDALAKGGMNVEAISAVSNRISLAGDYSRNAFTRFQGNEIFMGSLTLVCSVLDEEKDNPISAARFGQETWENVPDAIWALERYAPAHPKIHILKTSTRKADQMLSPHERKVWDSIRNDVFPLKPSGEPFHNAAMAHGKLLATMIGEDVYQRQF